MAKNIANSRKCFRKVDLLTTAVDAHDCMACTLLRSTSTWKPGLQNPETLETF